LKGGEREGLVKVRVWFRARQDKRRPTKQDKKRQGDKTRQGK
jgi:hypothetical protein